MSTAASSAQRNGNYAVYSWDEIRQHNHEQSAWLVVRGRIYDVTSFLKKHPAGPKAILRHAGTEASEHFDFHSADAQQLWAPYFIGYVEGYKLDAWCRIS